MVTSQQLRQDHQTGRWMREAAKGRETVPLYEMGDDGLKRRQAWQAGWDERDSEIKRERAA